MKNLKIGMVLAGGGARGAYQIGVWKALRELDIEKYIKVVSGTSIGSLNSVLFIQGDLEVAEKLWCSISKEKILPTANKDLLARGILIALGSKNISLIKKYIPKALEAGNISRSGLIEMLDTYVDFKKIRESDITAYSTCTEVEKLVPRYFRLNEYNRDQVKEILLATSALPMIYECTEIDENKYLDGGMVDNVPIQPVYGEGCDIIIVVNLSRNANIDKSFYPNTRFIEITPTKIDEGVVDGILDFTPQSSKKRIRQGYEDTINLFVPFLELFNFMKNDNKTGKKEYSNIFKLEFFNDLKGKFINKSKGETSTTHINE